MPLKEPMQSLYNQRFRVVLTALQKMVRRGGKSHIRKIVSKLHPADVAKLLRHFDPDEQWLIFSVIDDPEFAAEILSEADIETSERLIRHAPPHFTLPVLRSMSPDDLTDLLDQLPDDLRESILPSLKEDLDEVRTLMQYGNDTAGGIMTTDYVALNEHVRVEEAIKEVRAVGDKVMVSYLYVTDDNGRLRGVVSLRQLILAEPAQPLREIMTKDVWKVHVETDQEEVARLVAHYNILAIPVVDEHNVLVGVVTVDDIIDVIHEEASEDLAYLSGNSKPLHTLIDASPAEISRARLPWLVTALCGGLLSGSIIKYFTGTLAELISLSVFIPVIMAMGGHHGIQTSTVFIRGLATGEIHNILGPLWKEFRVGCIMGAVCGICLGLVGSVWLGSWMFGIVAGAAMFFALNTSAMMGVLLPAFFNRIGVDPAITAGPFITAIQDVTGLILYLGLATLLLPWIPR
ncbi:MAG TPA: magnesium transporter [Candidatus Tectomicrobia bacterium]|nr:magnesium transporter [Candidatus Tectomicrobia bacterium]